MMIIGAVIDRFQWQLGIFLVEDSSRTPVDNPDQPVRCSHMNTNVRKKRRAGAGLDDLTCAIPCFNGKLVRKLKGELPSEQLLDEARGLFSALSDQTRIKLLLALGKNRELCVCDLAHVAGTTISTASHHLRKLHDLRLLKRRNDGRMTYYSLRDSRLAQLVDVALGSVGAG